MKLRTLKDIDLSNKTVLYRAPYDIGVKKTAEELVLKDDLRIRATLPTLEYLLKENCRIVILTYVGRPQGLVEELRTKPHAKKLSELLNHPVETVEDCIGKDVEEKIKKMNGGDILMLENARFHREEMEGDDVFSAELCKGKDLVVFDGFPQAHRKHSSTTGILSKLPSVAGLYLEKEVEMLSRLSEDSARPISVIIGGAKISDKVDAINNLLPMADKVMVGGAIANVFLKAKGFKLGSSFIEDVFVDENRREKKDWVDYSKEILFLYKNKIVLPEDLMISDGNSVQVVNLSGGVVPDGWQALDIGPETEKIYKHFIEISKTIFFAGPMGKFEDERFAEGSKFVLAEMKKATKAGRVTIVAGGDTIEVAQKYDNLQDFSHISLAGGATLEFLAGKELPALKLLEQK